jgi:hypothetical protein
MTASARTGAILAVCALLTTTGCLGVLTGSDSLGFTASEASVEQAALDSTGYELVDQVTNNRTKDFSVGGQTRTVEVSNERYAYNRSVDLQLLGEKDLAQVHVLATPAVEIAGKTFNPVGDWSNRKLVRQVSSTYEGLGNVEHVGNRSVSVLGGERTVGKFAATAPVAGQQIDVYVHITKFRHGDDFLVLVGVHPQNVPDEDDRVNVMFGNTTHPSS